MLVKRIKYTDFKGVEKERDFVFHLSSAEVAEMELTTDGGISGLLKKISETQNIPELTKIFKRFILSSYGEISPDGDRFVKFDDDGRPLSRYFEETEAYSILFIQLATDANEALKFITGIMPKDLAEKIPDTPEETMQQAQIMMTKGL